MPTLDRGVLSEGNKAKREELIGMLKTAYWMEMETMMSHIANSVNPDGVRAQDIIESLDEDIRDRRAIILLDLILRGQQLPRTFSLTTHAAKRILLNAYKTREARDA